MPNVSTHTDIAVGVGLSAGVFYGIEHSVLGLALLGACVAHIYLEKMELKSMVLSILGSFVIAVVVAVNSEVVVMAIASHYFPFLKDALIENKARGGSLLAFIVGFSCQKLIPIFYNWLDRKKGA